MEIGITCQKVGSPMNAAILPDAKERLTVHQIQSKRFMYGLLYFYIYLGE